ncbi:MAG: PD-(D/E)XK nuclease family protein, partial [Opitutaceae bacterium]
MPLALLVLDNWAGRVPVLVAVFAPEDDAGAFDGWGRPLAETWSQRLLTLPEFERRVHLCADPAVEAQRMADAAKRHGEGADGAVALGIADVEITPLLENELSRFGLASYNPEGRARRGEGLFTLLSQLAALTRTPSFEAVSALARCPDVLAAVAGRSGTATASARWLLALDRLREFHLPADLAAAREMAGANPELRVGLDFVGSLYETLRAGSFPHNVVAALAAIFAERRFDLGRVDDAGAVEAAEAWRDVMRECAAAKAKGVALNDNDWWDVALRLFGDGRRTEDKPAGALELQGWLELLWEDAPHLVVAGLNDGFVPEAVVGDAFLPETLRVRLGLKTNAARFARDAYLLQALAACRPRLDVLLGKTSVAGEPLRPSRLLLRCPDADLPARVAFLFRELEAVRPGVPWTRAWQLTPPRVAPPTRVSVTALRAWLDCPFRFYLRHVLRMEALDPTKDELDARDFGTLVHGALETLGREEALRDCAEVAELRKFLEQALDRQVRRRFGTELTLPLAMQFEAARQRLAKAAEIEAGERAAGWRPVDVERKFSVEMGGLTVNGKIDRIDRHLETGAVRLLDYKTSDKPVSPVEAHLRALRRGEQVSEWRLVKVGGRWGGWVDLQLPLYEFALAGELGGGLSGLPGQTTFDFGGGVVCGYFNLPKAVGETGIALWEDFTPELRGAAGRCAEGVCVAIKAGEF